MADPILGAGAGLSSSMMMDPRLRPQDPLATPARAGLSGVAPMSMGFGNPQLDYLNQLRAANAAILSGASMGGPQPPVEQPTIRAYQNPVTGQLAVAGEVFNEDDYDKVLQGAQLLGQPTDVDAPPAPGFQPIPSAVLQQYAAEIKDFGMRGAFAAGLSRGKANIVGAGGALLTGLGAEETGGAWREYAQREQERLSPYQLRVRGGGGGEPKVFSYIAGLLGEMAPDVIATVVSGGVGYAAARGVVGTAAGRALSKFGTWASTKAGVGGIKAAAERILKNKASPGDERLMALVGGALAGSALYSQQRGAGEVYGEMLDRSTDPSFGLAQIAGVGYAALDLFPELAALKYAIGRPATKAAGRLTRAGRIAGAAVKGAGLEGVAEAGQEGISMVAAASTGASYEQEEAISRLVESAIAGATVGGVVGGAVNLLRRGPKAEEAKAEEAKTEFDEAGQGLLPFGGLPTQAVPPRAEQQLQQGAPSDSRAIPQGEQLELMSIPGAERLGRLPDAPSGYTPGFLRQDAPVGGPAFLRRGSVEPRQALPDVEPDYAPGFLRRPTEAVTEPVPSAPIGSPGFLRRGTVTAQPRGQLLLGVRPDLPIYAAGEVYTSETYWDYYSRELGVQKPRPFAPGQVNKDVRGNFSAAAEAGDQARMEQIVREYYGLANEEQSPASGPVDKGPQTGADVREGNTQRQKAARTGGAKGQKLKQGRKGKQPATPAEDGTPNRMPRDEAERLVSGLEKESLDDAYRTATSDRETRTEREQARKALREWIDNSEDLGASQASIDLASYYLDDVAEWEQGQPTKTKLADFNTPVRPINDMRWRSVVSRFKRSLAVRPDIRVYRDQLDLQRRDPQLYDELAKGYLGVENFDDLPAQGLSYGDKVVIFRSRIANERQLTQVMAHETMGHFGLRRIIPARKFDAVMQKLYAESEVVRSRADERRAARPGMSVSEAVEETLADNAEILNDSVVYRVHSQFKTALNKLGITFGDESMRYLLHQSRKYVRNGRMTGVFETDKVTQLINSVEDGSATGDVTRFSLANTSSLTASAAAIGRWVEAGLPDRFSTSDLAKTWRNAKNNLLSLTQYTALKNPALKMFYDQLILINQDRRRIMDELTRVLQPFYNQQVNIGPYTLSDGMTPEEVTTVGRVAYDTRAYMEAKLGDTMKAVRGEITRVQDGQVVANETVLQDLRQARPTRDMIQRGYSYEDTNVEVVTPARRQQLETEQAAAGTTDERRAEITNILNNGFERVKETVTVEPKPLTDQQWAAIQSIWNAQELMSVELAKASFDRNGARFEETLDIIARMAMTDKSLMTRGNRDFLRELHEKHFEIKTTGATVDDTGATVWSEDQQELAAKYIEQMNKALLNPSAIPAFLNYYDTSDHARITAGMDELRKTLKKSKDKSDPGNYIVQHALAAHAEERLANDSTVRDAKRTIARGYVPQSRFGNNVVRAVFKDSSGTIVAIPKEFRNQFIYSHFESVSAAERAATELSEATQGTTLLPVEMVSADDQMVKYMPKDVTVEWVAETLMQGVETTQNLDMARFTYALRRFGVQVRPDQMKKITLALQSQEQRRNTRLRSENVPGYSEDITRVISGHLEKQSAVASNVRGMPMIDRLLDRRLSRELWEGDAAGVAAAEAAWKDVEKSDNYALRQQRWQEFARAKYQWESTRNPGGQGRSGEFYNIAARQMETMLRHNGLAEAEFGVGATASRIKTYTGLIQLGGSIAGALLQMSSMFTNSVYYMAGINQKTGFGLASGNGPVLASLIQALRQTQTYVRADKMNSEYYFNLVEELRKRRQQGATFDDRIDGFRLDEAEMLAEQVANGVAAPALTQTMLRTSRGFMPNSIWERVGQAWMVPFNRCESNSRRAVILASYRLSFDAQVRASGKSLDQLTSDDISAFQQRATDEAVRAVNLSLGGYATVDRPLVWQTGLKSLLYTYKIYPTLVVQLMRNLPKKQAAAMVGTLGLISGLQGLPGAEDIEDLVDTLLQALGITEGSSRLAITEVLDDVVGKDVTPFIMRGIGGMFVGDIGAKFSAGNLIPGTDLGVTGANTSKVLLDIAGPAASATIDTLKFAGSVVGATTYAIGLSPVPSSYVGALRQAPVTMGRALGDAITYLQDGAVVDKRGYVISKEDVELAALARVFGLYPSSASRQYEKIRMMVRLGNYQRDVSSTFRNAAVRAIVTGDSEALQEIQRNVAAWNRAARGTGLETSRDWLKNAYTAAREARKPAGERTLKYTPTAARQRLAELVQ